LKYVIPAVFVLMLSLPASGVAQETTLDYKVVQGGSYRHVITNKGFLCGKGGHDLFGYGGLINAEYPLNSFEEHITEAGIWIGCREDSNYYVSVTTGESSGWEFYPTAEPWDTIWVVERNDTADIPYWQNYVGVSDYDYICRFNDYGAPSLRENNHTPLYLDVIQVAHSWTSPPLNDVMVVKYYIMPQQINLSRVYIADWMNGNVGYVRDGGHGLDDETIYDIERNIQICYDLPGGTDGETFGPVGNKLIPSQEHMMNDSLNVTFIWYNGRLGGIPSRDDERYADMSAEIIMEDQISTGDGTKSFASVGPYEIAAGDTLEFTLAYIYGESIQAIQETDTYVEWLVQQDYRTPSPPPAPGVVIKTDDQKVILDWDPAVTGLNPELYEDPYRADSILRPFEGYRVYKSTKSSTGPWTLLAEFDLPGNSYGSNTGISYTYTDVGLLNNVDYYYTVTAFSRPDTVVNFPALESSRNIPAQTVVPGTAPPETVGKVAVVPNPYRGDIAYYSYNPAWEKPEGTRDFWMEQDRRIQFINLPAYCQIKIYTLAGDLIATIDHDDPTKGFADWNLTSTVGQAISSGIYLYTVEDKNSGEVQVDKFVVIK
jgi:hypothetical protein